MDLALNDLQRLICHKTQTTNQPTYVAKYARVCYGNYVYDERRPFLAIVVSESVKIIIIP